ncbi:MAG: maltose ABC transporter substrate-binding protein [Anaerolineae bacterium]|nr:maltose ABC transporter substrate-binding protein [Anaerolineae bacterium]
MKSKKFYLMLVLVLFGALFLVACGGSDEPEETTTTSETTAEEAVVDTEATAEAEAAMAEEEAMNAEATADAEAAMAEEDAMNAEATAEAEAAMAEEEAMAEATEEPMEEDAAATDGPTLTIWADETRAPVLETLAEQFKADYGITLVIEQVAERYEQFNIAAPAGEGPDIMLAAHDRLGGFVESGLVAPIDLGAKVDNFTPESVQGFTYNSELYGMPYATENLAFFYNKDLIDTPPATWDEMVEMGQALMESGDATQVIALTGTTYDIFPLNTGFGGYIFGQDADGNYDPTDVGLDSEGFIASGDFLQGLVADGLISNTTDWDTAHVLFEQGDVPFLMAGPWALNRLRDSGVNYGIATFPTGPNGEVSAPFLGVQGFVVNALSENVLLAQTFLTELVANDDIMQALFDADPRPSAWIPVLEKIDDPDIAAFGEVAPSASLMPSIPAMSAVWGTWDPAIALILQEQETAEAALTNAATQIRDAIAEQ